MNNNIKVLKFGGTSQIKETYKMINEIIKSEPNNKFIIVLSAIKGITNKLLDFVNTKNFKLWHEILEINKSLNDSLYNNESKFIKYMEDKLWNLDNDKIEIVAMGEFFTTNILNDYLNENHIKSKFISSFDIIKSNQSNFNSMYNKGEFIVDSNKILFELQNNKVIIIPGFSGTSLDNKPCLLGRGGSDTSGSIIAAAVNAKEYQIWTDVDGIFSSDPRKISNTFLIKNIGYNASQEIAAMGAKIIHPYCILPCAVKHIPILIKNTFNKNAVPTEISNKLIQKDNLYGITLQENVKVFKITSQNMWNNYGFVYDIFSTFKKYNVDVNIINTSQFNITTTTDETQLDNLLEVREELSRNYNVELDFETTIVSIIGENIRKYKKIGRIFEISQKHDIILTSYSSNDMTLSFVVSKNISNTLCQELHDLLFI
jgi:aspartate kinase